MTCMICGAAHECPLKQISLPSPRPLPRGIHGILNVDKPAGLSSHSVVAAIRKASNLSRVGHSGTLDPMATGVLLIGVGQGVRVSEYLIDHDKKYHARVRLGVETDTYDATGKIVAQREVTATGDQIVDALQSFVGKLAQMPPAYSAIKKDGVPHYKLARRGEHVDTQPRDVEIFSIAWRGATLPDVEFDVHCSKGTYIRSLAHDLGEKLGCGGHLTALTRTAIGNFSLDDAVSLDQLRDAFANGFAERYVIPMDEALLQFEAIVIDPQTATSIQQGRALACGRTFTTPLLRAYSTSGEFIALLERGQEAGMWKPRKVFSISD
jgi:tRNA pseudouridine55 synthase